MGKRRKRGEIEEDGRGGWEGGFKGGRGEE